MNDYFWNDLYNYIFMQDDIMGEILRENDTFITGF